MFDRLHFLYTDIAFQVSNFLTLGGDVLLLIALAICVMWVFIIERALFFYVRYPHKAREVKALWEGRADHRSWQAHQIRTALLGTMRQQTRAYINTVKTLVALCPLLGLLGTVTGMIAVFDVMAHAGMGNPRLMADGVAKATVPAGTLASQPAMPALPSGWRELRPRAHSAPARGRAPPRKTACAVVTTPQQSLTMLTRPSVVSTTHTTTRSSARKGS